VVVGDEICPKPFEQKCIIIYFYKIIIVMFQKYRLYISGNISTRSPTLCSKGSGKSTMLKMLVAKFPEHIPRYFDCTTKARGALADEYEIYVDCTTDPTPLTFDEWLNS
jgi:hypothetical protein